MTADIVNLRRFKKLKARAEKQTDAERNRVRFGRTKAEKAVSSAEADQLARQLDGARLGGQAAAAVVVPTAANQGAFSSHSSHDDEDLDPGNVS